jgi:hypothetical protein
MFDANMHDPAFSNYFELNESSDLKLNVGLLDNSIIPMVDHEINQTIVETSVKTAEEPDYYTELNEQGTTVVINKYTTENNNDDTTVIVGGE